MKKHLIYIIIFFIIIFVLITSFLKLDNEKKHNSSTRDIDVITTIDDVELKIKYINGNMIDEDIPYGNKISKVIDINNDTDKNVSFAVSLSEAYMSDDKLTYSSFYSYDNSSYIEISKNINISKDDNLAYNLVISANSHISLKIDFYGNNESNTTEFKGKLSVISNLTEKDIFRKDVLAIHSNLLERINAINGINEKGYFIFSLSNLTTEILKDFSGFILIDASDYSELKYRYYIYNGKYMLDNYEVKNNDVEKKYIKDLDGTRISTFTFENICTNYTKKGCNDFNNLTFNSLGGKENFYKSSMEVINLVKNDFVNKDKLVYIYDVKTDIVNETAIRGYILINNTIENPEYYIYLTNDIYMISGYNLTKLGEYNNDSNTIRAYSDTSYNLSI